MLSVAINTEKKYFIFFYFSLSPLRVKMNNSYCWCHNKYRKEAFYILLLYFSLSPLRAKMNNNYCCRNKYRKEAFYIFFLYFSLSPLRAKMDNSYCYNQNLSLSHSLSLSLQLSFSIFFPTYCVSMDVFVLVLRIISYVQSNK